MKRFKNKKIIPFIFIALFVAGFFAASGAFALETGVEYGAQTGLGTQDIRVTIMRIIQVALGFLGIVALGLILYGGFIWMTSGGNADKIEQAKKILISSVIGLIIILTSFAIASFIVRQLACATGACDETGQPPVSGCTVGQCVACGIICSDNQQPVADPSCGTPEMCGPAPSCPRPNDEQPKICSIEATRGYGPGGVPQGTSGDYVTVSGWYFDEYDSTNSGIFFDDTLAETVQCSSSPVWYQNPNGTAYARIQVPNLPLENTYDVTLATRNGDTSNTVVFGIVEGNPIPAFACLEPVSGFNDDTLVKAEGIRFGDTAGELVFHRNRESLFTSWTDTLISEPVVPFDAMSGNVQVVDYAGQESNGIYFTVVCTEDSQCGTGCCSGFSCLPAEYCGGAEGESCNTSADQSVCDPSGICQPGLQCGTDSCVCELPSEGQPCNLDTDPDAPICVPGECEDNLSCDTVSCTCQRLPIIETVTPNNGAPNNFITIIGNNFGNNTGEVIFLGNPSPADDVIARQPQELNPQCQNTWTDTEIVVAIPQGAADGPLEVRAASGYFDRTDDGTGPLLGDFNVNDVVRPGLCLLSPSAGTASDPITLYGINFSSPAQVFFGQTLAGGLPVIGNTIISGVSVPAFSEMLDIGVWVKQSEEYSNPLTFSYEFTQGPYQCSSDANVCDPNSSLCGEGQFCNNSCQCETYVSCDADGSTPACQPNQGVCDPGFACNPNSCLCETAVLCDSDSGTPTCEPNSGVCPDGYSCDANANCTCQIDQEQTSEDSTYTWFFSTYTFGPQVVELCNRNNSCEKGTISSPSPFNRDGTDTAGYIVGSARPDDTNARTGESAVPIDSVVTGMLSTKVRTATLNNNTIKVFGCNDGSENFAKENCTEEISPSSLTVIECNYLDFTNPDAHCFTFIAGQLLTQDRWYEVRLDAPQIIGQNGVALTGNDPESGQYRWVFKTRASSELSQVACVYVDPASQSSFVVNEEKDWQSSASPQDYTCVVMNPNSCDWDWRTEKNGSPTEIANISSVDPAAPWNAKTASLVHDSNPPIDVFAQCTFNDGQKENSGDLYVDFESPRVLERFPDCGTACLNSKIGARFSRPMDYVSITNAMSLYVCFDDASCQNGVPVFTFQKPIGPDYAEADNTYTGSVPCYDTNADGTYDYCLVPDTYYRVVIAGTARSAADDTDRPLTGLNYDDPTNGLNGIDSYSWVFQTQENYGLCMPEVITVNPQEYHSEVSEAVPFGASPKTKPDQCSPDIGQRLNPMSWTWDWDTNSTKDSFADPFCSASVFADLFTQTPNAFYCSDRENLELLSSCGNLRIEIGEDCDDGNVVDGDGCSSICVNEGTAEGSVCGNNVLERGEDCDTESVYCVSCQWIGNNNYNQDVCGNGIVEPSEYCEAPGTEGCALDCTLTGTVRGRSLCGDGQIGIGEECDSGELFDGGTPQNGDAGNCSSVCRIENRDVSYLRKNNVFDFKKGPCTSDAGEYTCINIQSVIGNQNTDPVCGNLFVEEGEQCDVGGWCNTAADESGAWKRCSPGNQSFCATACEPQSTYCSDNSGPCGAVGSQCGRDSDGNGNPDGQCMPYGCSRMCIHTGSVYTKPGPYQVAKANTDGEAYIQSFIEESLPSGGGPLGQAYMTIGNFISPDRFGLIDVWPKSSCEDVCLNSAIGGLFNKSFRPVTVAGPADIGAGEAATIKLYECTTQDCSVTSARLVEVSVIHRAEKVLNDTFDVLLPANYNPVDNDSNPLTPRIPTLIPNTYYRVIVSESVTSLDGQQIDRNYLNFDDPTFAPNRNDSYSWIFKTQLDNTICKIEKVEVKPSELTVPEGQGRYQYFSQPWGQSQCHPSGQRLNAYQYNWNWNDEELDEFGFVNAANLFTYREGGPIDDIWWDYLPQTPSEADQNRLLDGCGNGIVERGEDCDAGLSTVPGCGLPGTERECRWTGAIQICTEGTAENCCGNGVVERGEECDSSNSYCSPLTCLLTGNTNYNLSVCGNGKIEFNEQCDAGENNGTLASGCTIFCTLSGVTLNGPELCGNGRISTGEQCDNGELSTDSPSVSGDGCTGSTTNPVVNGTTVDCLGSTTRAECESAEKQAWCSWTGNSCIVRSCLVEDQNRSFCRSTQTNIFNFVEDCTADSSICSTGWTCQSLASLNSPEVAGTPVCGNDIVEQGERCDIGGWCQNSENSWVQCSSGETTGCATECLPYDGLCSSDTSPCNIIGSACGSGGECISNGCTNNCTLAGSVAKDNRNDPFQIAETVLKLPTMLTKINEEIKAWHSLESLRVGLGVITVTSDAEVPFKIIGSRPPEGASNQCLNVAMWAAFSRELDEDKIAENFRLCSGDCDINPNIVRSYRYKEVKGECVLNETLGQSQCQFPEDIANVESILGLCDESSDCIGSMIEVYEVDTPNGFLLPNDTYEISVSENIATSEGETLDCSTSTCSWGFETGTSVCSCDYVGVRISNTSGNFETTNDYFTCAGDECGMSTETISDDDVNYSLPGNQHEYEARCYTVRLDENPDLSVLEPLGYIGQRFDWTELDPDNLIEHTFVYPEATDPTQSFQYIISNNDNGESAVNVLAQQYQCTNNGEFCAPGATCGGDGQCLDKPAANQTINILNFMCDNPWPAFPNFPYIDNESQGPPVSPDLNFRMYYCRDSGADGPADDLPALAAPLVRQEDASAGFLKSLIFPIDGSDEAEAIGVRAMANPLRLSARTWYQSGFCGGIQEVDRMCSTDADCSIDNSLVAYYQLDGNAIDETGGNNGENYNVSFVPGKDDRGAYFEGRGDSYIQVPIGDDLKITGDLTVSAWIRADSNADGYRGIVASTLKWPELNGWSLGNELDSSEGSKFYFRIWGQDASGTYRARNAIKYNFFRDYTNQLVHVAGVYSKQNNTIKLYINGAEVATDSTSILPNGISYHSTTPLVIGRRADGEQGMWKGLIDEVRIYRRALSANEVKSLYESEQFTCVLNVPQPGTPENTEVDRHQAIRDGRTTYVGAANMSAPLSSSAYANVLLLSYNQDSSDSTKQIYNRILDAQKELGGWEFSENIDNKRVCVGTGLFDGTDVQCSSVGSSNHEECAQIDNSVSCGEARTLGCGWDDTNNSCVGKICQPIYCTSNYDCPNFECDASREKLVRDVKRFADLRDMQLALRNYSAKNQSVPDLSAGSYVATWSLSVWPSWRETLSQQIGGSLPQDPLNRLDGCPSDDPDQAQTCWDELTQLFSCPSEAFIYAYEYDGTLKSFNLYTNVEYAPWSTGLYALPLPSCTNAGNVKISSVSSTLASHALPCDSKGGDGDGDGVCDGIGSGYVSGYDNCPARLCGSSPSLCYNPDQKNSGGTSLGDVCDAGCSGDADGDNKCDSVDLCPLVFDDQTDSDGDGYGDACDPCTDRDRDGYWDVDTGANDSSICQKDNCSLCQGTSCEPGQVTIAARDRAMYCKNSDITKVCKTNEDCGPGGRCEPMWDFLQTYNPNQEDYDNDGIGYICDQCIDFDSDKKGDYTFYFKQKYCSNDITKTCNNDANCGAGARCTIVAPYTSVSLDEAKTWHFAACEGSTASNSKTGLDNCPAGPGGANCVDQFGVSVSCSNPTVANWIDITGNENQNSQIDYNLNAYGDICDPYGYISSFCGDGYVDQLRINEACDCSSPDNPFGVCQTDNNVPCEPGSGQTECQWCNGCSEIRTEFANAFCGDGEVNGDETCDDTPGCCPAGSTTCDECQPLDDGYACDSDVNECYNCDAPPTAGEIWSCNGTAPECSVSCGGADITCTMVGDAAAVCAAQGHDTQITTHVDCTGNVNNDGCCGVGETFANECGCPLAYGDQFLLREENTSLDGSVTPRGFIKLDTTGQILGIGGVDQRLVARNVDYAEAVKLKFTGGSGQVQTNQFVGLQANNNTVYRELWPFIDPAPLRAKKDFIGGELFSLKIQKTSGSGTIKRGDTIKFTSSKLGDALNRTGKQLDIENSNGLVRFTQEELVLYETASGSGTGTTQLKVYGADGTYACNLKANPATCSDGTYNSSTEACDCSGSGNSFTCTTDNNEPCSPAAGSSCNWCSNCTDIITETGAPIPPVCGNGSVESGEQCDNGASNGTVCTPPAGGTCTWCTTSCQQKTETGPTPAVCGNGSVESGEQCDNGASNGTVCTPPAGGTCTWCTAGTCQLRTETGAALPVCGNGIVESGEACDGAANCGPNCQPINNDYECDPSINVCYNCEADVSDLGIWACSLPPLCSVQCGDAVNVSCTMIEPVRSICAANGHDTTGSYQASCRENRSNDGCCMATQGENINNEYNCPLQYGDQFVIKYTAGINNSASLINKFVTHRTNAFGNSRFTPSATSVSDSKILKLYFGGAGKSGYVKWNDSNVILKSDIASSSGWGPDIKRVIPACANSDIICITTFDYGLSLNPWATDDPIIPRATIKPATSDSGYIYLGDKMKLNLYDSEGNIFVGSIAVGCGWDASGEDELTTSEDAGTSCAATFQIFNLAGDQYVSAPSSLSNVAGVKVEAKKSGVFDSVIDWIKNIFSQ